MNNMTIEQLQMGLDYMKRNLELAAEAGDTGLSEAFAEKIYAICIELNSRFSKNTIEALKELQNAN